MSAMHALAYGMLELQDKNKNPRLLFESTQSSDDKEALARDHEIIVLVKQEFTDKGFLLSHHIERFKSNRGGVRSTLKRNQYDLFSPQLTQVGFGPRREQLGEGLTLKEACLAALAYIEPNNTALNVEGAPE